MTLKENIMKLQTYKMFEGEDTLYVERDDVLKLLKQEPRYCDRNICLRNEYNGIGCDECEVTKSQQPSGDLISRQAVIDITWEEPSYTDALNVLTEVRDKVKALPPVKPQEKTGHWQHYEGMLICSECGTEFYDDIMEYCGDDVPKCCPDCGYNMVEPQKDEKINCKATKCENCKNHNYCDYEPQERSE